MSVVETMAVSGSCRDFRAGGNRYTVRIADTRELREKAYRLMYDIYVKIGYGHPHPSRMWYSLYGLLPDTVTVLVMDRDRAVATMTVVFDSPFGLPDDANYPEELNRQRAFGRNLAQIISLGVRADVCGGTKVLVKLFNFAYFVARGIRGATDFVNTVIPRHAPFYYHKLLFEHVGEERYQPKTGVNVVLIKLDFNEAEAETHREHGSLQRPGSTRHTLYKHFASVQEAPEVVESLASRIRPITREDLDFFLERRPEIWERAALDRKIRFDLVTGRLEKEGTGGYAA
ncbi:hypothetical protein ACFL01_02595 [Planctomycetota bacterium]